MKINYQKGDKKEIRWKLAEQGGKIEEATIIYTDKKELPELTRIATDHAKRWNE